MPLAAPPPPTAPPVPSASRAAATAPSTGDPGVMSPPSSYYTPPPASLPSPPLYFNSYGAAIPGPGWNAVPWSGLGNPNVTQNNQYIPGTLSRLNDAYTQQNATNNYALGVANDPTTQALTDWINSQYQSNLSRLQSQLSNLGTEADYQSSLKSLNTGFANEDYNLTLARIANQEAQNVNLPRQDIAANQAYYNTLAGLLPQTRALNLQAQQNAYGRSQLDYDTAFRNSLSDATARGAVNSQGLRDTRDEIARQLGLSRGSADIQYGRESIAATQNEADLKRQQALLNTKNQTLDEVAKQYGIDRQTAELSLRQGLAKLGLDFDATIKKINSSSGDLQKQLQLLKPMLWQQAMSLAGQG